MIPLESILLVVKVKTITKLLSFLAKYLWIEQFGLSKGMALIISIYVHEYGHYFMADELKLKPKVPRFIPFLGAYVKYNNSYNDKMRFKVAFSGPLLGGMFGVFCFYIDYFFHIKFFHYLAIFSILLNLTNLIPFAITDGGHIAKTLGFNEFRLFVTAMIIYYAYVYKTYSIIVIGVIGIISYFVPEEHKLTPMSKNDKEYGIFLYLVLAAILALHMYFLIKK